MKLVREFEDGDIVMSMSYPWTAVREDGTWRQTDDHTLMSDRAINSGLDREDYKYLGNWKDLKK